jgi:hypothetical protein
MPQFPSVDWLNAARESLNQDPEYRALGSADYAFGIKSGESVFRVDFEAFECTSVDEIPETDLRDTDFYLEMSPAQWRTYLESVQGETPQSLSDLDLTIEGGIVRGEDERRKVAFPQYLLSLERFFQQAGRIETSF